MLRGDGFCSAAVSRSPEQRARAVVGRAVGEGRGVVRGGVVQRRVVSRALNTRATLVKAVTKIGGNFYNIQRILRHLL